MGGASLWHDVDLRVRTWLGHGTGLFHYVNEVPSGTFQKFEVQPGEVGNAIVEDPVGSERLRAFGRPLTFNYGCFPQTYRDPEKVDRLYGAPGDDDPLDVLDLGGGAAGVGEVVRCRPLGAVCLIDEGQADWKILAVSVDRPGPLASARSVADVERIVPGRVGRALQWIDDFKRSSCGGTARLHLEVHGAAKAVELIEEDHASWKALLAEAGSDGFARGHWIRPARPGPEPRATSIGWASPVWPPVAGAPTDPPLAGAFRAAASGAPAPALAPGGLLQRCRAPAPRRPQFPGPEGT